MFGDSLLGGVGTGTRRGAPLPPISVSIDSKRVADRRSVSIESKEVKVALESAHASGLRNCRF